MRFKVEECLTLLSQSGGLAACKKTNGFFVHDRALCESSTIGEGIRVWAYAHILPRAVLGKNCNICDGVFIENDVIVGDDVTIKCGVQLWDGLRVGNGVFIGPNATFRRALGWHSAFKMHFNRQSSLKSRSRV